MLSVDGISSSYGIRHLMGETYLRALWTQVVATDQTPWWRKQQELTKASLAALGITWDPFLSHSTYSGWSAGLGGPTVQPEMQNEEALLAADYIDLLDSERDLDVLRRETFTRFQPRGLLYALLRHGLLLEYWAAALNLFSARAIATGVMLPLREAEIVSVGGTTTTPWDLLNTPAAHVSPDSLWTFLSGLTSAPADPQIAQRTRSLLEFRESLRHLKTVSATRLERTFAGTLDLCSHRLDAWVTSVATRRLADMRRATPTGLLLGGYGWVVNLKPAPPSPPDTAPPGETGPDSLAARQSRLLTHALSQSGVHGGGAAQRPPDPRRRQRQRSAGARPVVTACPPRRVVARRRPTGTTVGRVARIPFRAPAAARATRRIHSGLPRGRAAGGAQARPDSGSARPVGRIDRRQQRRRRPRAQSEMEGLDRFVRGRHHAAQHVVCADHEEAEPHSTCCSNRLLSKRN